MRIRSRHRKGAASLIAAIHKAERGQIFGAVVLMMGAFGAIGAVGVDLGSYTAERRDLQNAADAIALAAAQNLPNGDSARGAASVWATKNDVSPSHVTVTITEQNAPSTPNPMVHVAITRSHPFTFARLIGISSAPVSATATAIRTSPGGSNGLVPWSVQRALLDTITPGTSVVMKYDSNDVTGGNFGAIRIDGNGSNVYSETIEQGSINGLCAASVAGCPYPSTINLETGNLVGGTRTGTNFRLENADSACDTWEEAVDVHGQEQFIRAACNPFAAGGNSESLRIIVIPVIGNLCNGSCTVTITEFALFFLEGYGDDGCTGNSCAIRGRFISSNTNYGADVGVYNEDTLAHFVKLTS